MQFSIVQNLISISKIGGILAPKIVMKALDLNSYVNVCKK